MGQLGFRAIVTLLAALQSLNSVRSVAESSNHGTLRKHNTAKPEDSLSCAACVCRLFTVIKLSDSTDLRRNRNVCYIWRSHRYGK